MKLHLWDVQHGSAAYLLTPSGEHIVIDLGVGDISQGDMSFSPLRLLQSNGVRQIDELIITHPHRDHLDDIDQLGSMGLRVLRTPRHLREDEIRGGNKPGDQSIIEKYIALCRYYSEPVASGADPCDAAQAGMAIECFFPMACARTSLNDQSIVTFMNYEGVTVCLPGDNESPSWRELMALPRFREWLKQTNVFVAAHHGREAGYCEDVFALCKPYIVIVSDGPCDTTAVDKYWEKASGWKVWSRSSGEGKQRRVLTTRSDGSVYVTVGRNQEGAFLEISIE